MLGLSSEKTESPKGLLSNILNVKTDANDDKFSLLLKSFTFGKNDKNDLLKDLKLGRIEAKGISKGLDTLLKADTLLPESDKADAKKGSALSSLSKLFALGNEELGEEELIHSDILKALPTKEFKQNLQQLIGEAKSYLKDKISQKIDISDGKELPKTLGGLIKLAEKSGIDVRSIGFESLPQTPVKESLAQALNVIKPLLPTVVPHSTSQLVKPEIITKKEQSTAQKPLDALLSKDGKFTFDEAVKIGESPKTGKTSLFNALLHGENSEVNANSETEATASKIETEKTATDKTQLLQQSKTDPLSAKIVEAKQLVQHVAQSMKEAVENYKPPFTRIKMQLNPQKFGEMDVTLIQRGNNVHININANTSALTLMMQNSHELKSQLAGQGLGDASMNFSSHQQQQGEKQRQEHAGLSYEEYQDYEEEFTEIATALEVVVPRYI